MGATVETTVLLPQGTPAAGASIHAFNRNAWATGVRHWEGTTDSRGHHTWVSMDTGWAGDLYDFIAEFVDSRGVRWRGESTQRIKGPSEFVIGLTPFVPPVGDFPEDLIEQLGRTEGGRAVLQALGELEVARRSGLQLTVVAMSSVVVEGLIQAKCRASGAWDEKLTSEPLGVLIQAEPIRKVIPRTWLERLERFSKLRGPGAEVKSPTSQPEEASLAVGIVRGLAQSLFRE